MKRLAIIVCVLAGCAPATPRNDPPALQFTTEKTVEETVPCIISSLDAIFESFRHSADTVVPNQRFEIRHHQPTFNNEEPYFVRVEREPDGGSKVTVFALSSTAEEASVAAGRCR